ncbi:MAG: helix-turn-helix domain-containing protein [Armatimonadota bacterium]
MALLEVYHHEFADENFPVAILPFSSEIFSYSLHTHPFTELAVILGGHGMHVLGETTCPVQTGDIYVVTSGNAHEYQEIRNLEAVNVIFMPEVLRQYEADFRLLPGYHALFVLEPQFRLQHGGRSRLHLSPEAMTFVMTCISRMKGEEDTALPGYQTMITTTLAQLILYLSRQYIHTTTASSRMLMQIGEVISRMEREYMHSLTLQSLADTGSMSIRNLVRRFREGTSMAPIEYLIRLRIHHATALLRAGEDSITDIAAAVGMPDSNYFSRQFKRLIGLTPRAYRRDPSSS